MKKIFLFMMDLNWPKQKLVLLILLVSGLNLYSQTCDSLKCNCDEGDMNPSGIMLGHNHPKGSWMLSYRYMTMQMKDNLAGTEKVSDEFIFQNYIMTPQSMTMSMHMVMVMYGITDKLSVMAMFNYNVNSMNMTMLPGTMQMQMNGMTMVDNNGTSMSTITSGLGDIKFYAMYSIYDVKFHQIILSAGVSIPSGCIRLTGNREDMMYENRRLPYMMQMGTGTYDLLPGATYLYKRNKFLLGAQATGSLRFYTNSVGYNYSNDVTAGIWLAYRVLPWLSVSARAEAVTLSSINGKDPQLFEVMEPAANSANYGGERLSAYPGLNIYLKKFAKSKISIEYGFPLYQNLNGIQLSTKALLYAAWAVSF